MRCAQSSSEEVLQLHKLRQARSEIMFSKDRFIQDCRTAVAEGQGEGAIREIVAEAVSNATRVMAELGEPAHAGITALYRAHDLTILQFTWAPYMALMPHNHQMFAVIGIYAGREDNIFWRRKERTIEAASARSLGAGDVVALGRDTIHSVTNPIGKMSSAIHVYGGDFFAPDEPRSEWEHETLAERPWDIERVKVIFREAEQRFNAVKR
jgi:predicted metal-dependent enzyme (double-stranded beta helix superfamily)